MLCWTRTDWSMKMNESSRGIDKKLYDNNNQEYQIERLHIIGDERPSTGLKNKVKRINFKQVLDVVDPITFETTKQPLKPFMVTQLQIAFEREKMILSPFDETLYKQLIDYSVERIGSNGQPIFTSENEHFVDALGLAYLAMVLEFKELTDMMKEPETTTKVQFTKKTLGSAGLNRILADVENTALNNDRKISIPNYDPTERRGDRQTHVKVGLNYRKNSNSGSWGSRSSGTRSGGGFGRNAW